MCTNVYDRVQLKHLKMKPMERFGQHGTLEGHTTRLNAQLSFIYSFLGIRPFFSGSK